MALNNVLVGTILVSFGQNGESIEVNGKERCDTALPCTFPFFFNAQLHFECTNDTDPEGKFWCSTQTHKYTKEHIQDQWKYCDFECPGEKVTSLRPELQNITTTTEPAKPRKRRPPVAEVADNRGNQNAAPKLSFLGPQDGGAPTKSAACRTIGGKTPDQPCIFPFKYRGKIYYSCTWVIFHITKGPWCSTQVDEDGEHIRGQFGICGPATCDIPPRECGRPTKERKLTDFDTEDRKLNVSIQSLPWMASLGTFSTDGKWQHECGGSLITNYHILTAAHCFNSVELPGYPYKAHLGSANLEVNGTSRDVVSILRHPKYRSGRAYFDVGLATVGKKIEFTDYILPICLPFLPVDDEDDLANDFVILSGWGYNEENQLTNQLSVENLAVHSKAYCSELFSDANIQEFGAQPIKVLQQLPEGITPEVVCVGSPIAQAGSCNGDSGSPVVRLRSDTSRAKYYEAVFLVSGGINCKLQAQIYTRLTNRQILTWIQTNTETSPFLMVVGGYNEEFFNGLLRDVELISPEPGNLCTKRVRPLLGRSFNISGNIEFEAATLGMTGQVTKDTVIFCGGKNGDDNLNTCYQYDTLANDWIKSPTSKLPSMLEKRYLAGSSLDERGDLWVLGGSNGAGAADSTEIFDFKSKTWKRGKPLPSYYRDSGLNSHCVVRLNKTHVVIAGGFASEYTISNNQGQTLYNSGESQDKVWLHDGNDWAQLEPMSVRRDRPACSLVQLADGQIRVLVAGGCEKWCAKFPAISSAEMLDVNTGKWTPVADLPIPLMSAQMQIFDGFPSIVGGYDNNNRNGKIFQYDEVRNQWFEHPTAQLRIPRSSPAVIQVPKGMFADC